MKKKTIKIILQVISYVVMAVAGYYGISLVSSCQGLHYWSTGTRVDSIYYEAR